MNDETEILGELEPLTIRKHLKQPEKRQVSGRWLASLVLVGASAFLMIGGALFTALDGREKLTTPAQAYSRVEEGGTLALKGNRPTLLSASEQDDSSDVMMVSTVTRVGEKNVVKERPFLNINTPLAIAHETKHNYPAFNPLSIFSESSKFEIVSQNSDFMYGADVEGEVTLNTIDFPLDQKIHKTSKAQRSAEVSHQVRLAAKSLETGGSYVSALALFDNTGLSLDENLLIRSTNDVTIVPENVSVLKKTFETNDIGTRYTDRRIEIRADISIKEALLVEGINEGEIQGLVDVLSGDLGEKKFRENDIVQTWLQEEVTEVGVESTSVAMMSVFRGSSHLVSIARNDVGDLVYIAPMENRQEILEDDRQPLLAARNLPSVYDGIYRAALSEGLSKELAASLIKIFAFDVDFRSRITPVDYLELFVSLEDDQTTPTAESEILYAGLQLGKAKRHYYRFRDQETGRVDYYDETGKSAKKFLLRQPVPNGKFRSGYGKRLHPISRRYKLHKGVDWAAPRGTPILAAGNGVIEKAGWSGTGYGKQTFIRHSNGYKTSYAHQTAVAKGIKPGVRVRQGQIIGYVGSTGYSTGPHLHYEVTVNGNHVDPMRIRLPKGKILKDSELAAFEAERDRINQLINRDDILQETEIASN